MKNNKTMYNDNESMTLEVIAKQTKDDILLFRYYSSIW